MPEYIDKNIRFIDELNSTNTFAKDWLLQVNLPEWSIVRTNFQTTGVGQGSNKWVSEKDQNLLISIILYPRFLPLQRIFTLNQVISLGILDFVKFYVNTKPITIKWPNDVYVLDKKNSGILLINNIRQEQLLSTIVGIGINVNQTTFPEDIPNPISFKMVTGNDYNLPDCLNTLIEKLQMYYEMLMQEKYTQLYQTYLDSLYLYNTDHQFTDLKNNQFIYGKIIGITLEGLLQIQVNNTILNYDLKEIQY